MAAATPSAPPAAARGTRLAYIDAVRGACIVSMLTLHLAETARLTTLTHPFVVVDGAHGFVILAGFVLGMVEGRRVNRGDSLAVTRRAAGRRLGLLATGHWAVVLLIVFGNAVFRAHSLVSEEFASTSIGNQLWRTLTFRTMPDNVNILPMYLFFIFLGGFVYAPLLRKGRADVVVALSASMYLASHAGNGTTWLLTPFAVLAWQALFTAGMVTGWYSTQARELRRRTHPASFLVAAALPILCAVLARERFRAHIPGADSDLVDNLISKLHLGFLNLLGGLGLVVALGVIAGGLERRGHFRRSIDWLALLGRRSLACYLAISVLAWVTHVLPPTVQQGWHAEITILAGIAITTVVALVRDRVGARGKRPVPAAAVATAPA
jgi:hypothetical protein